MSNHYGAVWKLCFISIINTGTQIPGISIIPITISKTKSQNEIRNLVIKHNILPSILEADEMLEKTGINYKVVNFNNQKLPVKGESYSEVRIRGMPDYNEFPILISECKRVLSKKGRLSIRIPYVFFEEPKKASLMEFIRITAETLFPELGLVEGNKVNEIIKTNFAETGFYETNLGEVVFWAVK